MKTFFTSDTHFGHSNIIRYCKRPFKDAYEMDAALIENWNAKVQPGDTVYHLGDFVFATPERAERVISQLNGQKFLIFGNHDKTIKSNSLLRDKFVKCCDYHEVYIQDPSTKDGRQHIVLSHYAMLVWNKSHHGSWMLHGHSHGTLSYPFEGKIMDVGSDCHNYAPISYDEIKQKLSKIVTKSVDHHGE